MNTEQEILHERARALARPADDGSLRAGMREVVQWARGQQRFAVELGAVRAIVPAGQPALVPQAPGALIGMVAFRGGLLPVYEPGALLEPATGPTAGGAWAIVVDDDAPFGLVADALPEIAVVTDADLRPAGMDLSPDARRCVAGVDRGGTVLLSADAVRTHPLLTSTKGTDMDEADEETAP